MHGYLPRQEQRRVRRGRGCRGRRPGDASLPAPTPRGPHGGRDLPASFGGPRGPQRQRAGRPSCIRAAAAPGAAAAGARARERRLRQRRGALWRPLLQEVQPPDQGRGPHPDELLDLLPRAALRPEGHGRQGHAPAPLRRLRRRRGRRVPPRPGRLPRGRGEPRRPLLQEVRPPDGRRLPAPHRGEHLLQDDGSPLPAGLRRQDRRGVRRRLRRGREGHERLDRVRARAPPFDRGRRSTPPAV
mmetsp:Transcript_48577/g.143378  ORF Transcript_48577/g.143378 Transcript_48577/m.143378 type:complete len:243 (-) Transcript_48577:70-798(-)